MGKSITGALQMSDQKILKGSHSVTSSPESVDGAEHYSSQDGVQTDQSGLEVRHASHSLQPGKEREKTTSDISGQSSLISSASANLQQSLENKLRQLSDLNGSTIYKLTLKKKDTPQGRSYYHLAASALRIKGTDSSSWPTPRVADTNNLNNSEKVVQSRVEKGRATVAEMVTHNTNAWLNSGEAQKSSTAETESTVPSQLNPRFSLWLMGYPIEWAYCAERVTPSSRKRQRKS
jgi:hypothetical protein